MASELAEEHVTMPNGTAECSGVKRNGIDEILLSFAEATALCIVTSHRRLGGSVVFRDHRKRFWGRSEDLLDRNSFLLLEVGFGGPTGRWARGCCRGTGNALHYFDVSCSFDTR